MIKARKNEIMKSIEVLAVKAAYGYEFDDAVKAIKVIKKVLKCNKGEAVQIFVDIVNDVFHVIEYDEMDNKTWISGFEALRDPQYHRECSCLYDSVMTNYYFRD